MWKNFLLKLKESLLSVIPITVIVFALIFFLVPADNDSKILLFASSILLIFGMSLFSLGADNSMIELGKSIGSTLSKSKKLWFMLILSFVIGFMITFAEPDLMVLAMQVEAKSSLSSIWIFISTVSLGVGIFLMLAIFRLVFRWKLSYIMTICYTLILVLAFFVPQNFMPIAFDSGSVTTGPISVPFLITFGLGLSAVRSGDNEDDSFGLIALCSAGPILAVMIMSLFLNAGSSTSEVSSTIVYSSMIGQMSDVFFGYVKDVALVILPIVVIFVVFQIFSFKFPKQKVAKMLTGFALTYSGIVLFLTGVECGYMNMGNLIGSYIGSLDYRYIAIPIGFVLGAFAILAEPALHVLKKQVEDITGGVIKQKVIVIFVSIGVALSVVMAVIQAMYNFSLLYIIVPVYVLCLVLAQFNSKLFTAVAFDSGGVATGAMAVSFILPMVMGLSTGDSQGFGTIALIAVFPIFTMQLLGFVYKMVVLENKRKENKLAKERVEIVEFDDFDFDKIDEPDDKHITLSFKGLFDLKYFSKKNSKKKGKMS